MTIRASLLGAIAALGLAAAAHAASWDLPTPYAEGNFHTQNIQTFADDVAQATDGDLEITLHPAQSLIKHADIKNAVRDGLVPAGEILVSRLENENPIFGVDSVPFLATDYAEAKKLYDAQKPYLEKLLEAQGLTLLFSVPWPPQGIYTKKPIASIADLKGLTFRAYNKGTERVAQLAGMIPAQVEASDVPTAFSTGRVEAMITSPSTGVDSKAWDFLDHYYDTQAWIPRNMVFASTKALDALPEKDRAAVMEAAAAAETRGWAAAKTETETKTKMLADNGIEVAPPSPELQAAFKDIGVTMTEEWKAAAGDDGAALLDAYAK